MPTGTLQIRQMSGHVGHRAGRRRAARGRGLQVHRRHDVHRLQGVRGRVRRVERHAVPADDVRQHVSDDAVDGVELLEPDQVQRAPAGRRHAEVADAQGPVHALRGSRLPARVPGRRRHRPVHQRHRRLPAGELHRLPVLRVGMSVRHPEVQQQHEEGLQVHAVLGPRRAGARAGVHQVVPDGVPEVRHEGRHARDRRRARARSCASTRDFRTPASTIRRRVGGTHVIYVLHDITKPESVRRAAGQSADSGELHALEARGEAGRAAARPLRRAGRVLSLHRRGPERATREPEPPGREVPR